MTRKQLVPDAAPRSARSIARSKLSFLPGVSLLLTLCACSTVVSQPPLPKLQANLSHPCPPPPQRPTPFTDPDRLVWENDLLTQYGDCGLRHLLTVEAWPTEKK